jgi:hypothetical protein
VKTRENPDVAATRFADPPLFESADFDRLNFAPLPRGSPDLVAPILDGLSAFLSAAALQ